jgi:hypothetical protein
MTVSPSSHLRPADFLDDRLSAGWREPGTATQVSFALMKDCHPYSLVFCHVRSAQILEFLD